MAAERIVARPASFLAHGGLGLPARTELSGAHTGLGLSRGQAPVLLSWSSWTGPWRQQPLGLSPGDRAITVPALPQAAPCGGPSPSLPAHGESSPSAGVPASQSCK